jgi:hypothetical protein
MFLISFGIIYLLLSSGKPINKKGRQIQTNDYYNHIAVNEVLMWVSNNGDGSHDPYTDGNGFYWPGGLGAEDAAVFEDGLVWGGVVDGEIRVNGNTHFQGLQAGKILPDGRADDPSDPKYRVYKINKNWQNLPNGPRKDALERDYNEWPVEDGAPWVDVDGDEEYTSGTDQPDFVGDEVLWFVSNDLDTNRTNFTYGSDPIGLEIQTLVWGYKSYDFLKDVVFKKYVLIHKGTSSIENMYLTYWTDNDLGDASDDWVGCDTLLNLGFVYNGTNQDGDGAGITYGLNPPSVGHMFIQGPIVPGAETDSARFKDKWIMGHKNAQISSFMLIISAHVTYNDPNMGSPIEFYNNMQGLFWNGNPVIDPNTGLVTTFCVPGDPVLGEGWYEGEGFPGGENPDDRRYMMSSGPLFMAPGDTQEVVLAIFMAGGKDHIDSITELKKTALKIHDYIGNQITDYWFAGDFECTIEKDYMRARKDSMKIEVTFSNPDEDDYRISAIIKSIDQTYQDTVLLYDDGNHHDQNADDGIWGGIIGPLDAETEFGVSCQAVNVTGGVHLKSKELAYFNTIGPVIVDYFEITSEDTLPNPGDQLRFNLTLKNDGIYTGVTDITSRLVSLDSCSIPVGQAFPPEYGNLDPGESSGSDHGQSVNFSMECADSFWTSIKVEIYSDDELRWVDTISVFIYGSASTVEENDFDLPTTFSLSQNYPNPFNPSTIINYELPITKYVELTIYDILGQKVKTLVSKNQQAGYYQVEWDASGFASGVYYYQIRAGEFWDLKKMVLIR